MSEGHKNLIAALDKLNKTYGKNTVNPMKEMDDINVERMTTGFIPLDIKLKGGYPKGRIIEVYGPESSGKTTLLLHAIAEAQQRGEICAFIDMEHAFDPAYAEKVGVDVDALIFSQPDNGEQALEIIDALVRTGDVSIVILDSVAAMKPKSEIEGDYGDANVGKHARLMSQAMGKLKGIVSKSNTTLFFINQLREKIGVMFGSPETTTGGNSLKFFASVRIDIRRGIIEKDGDVPVGALTKVKMVKSKTSRPFAECQLRMVFGEGFSKIGSLLEQAVDDEVIKKSGSWYSYGDTKLGQGKDAAIEILKDNPELVDEITLKIKQINQILS